MDKNKDKLPWDEKYRPYHLNEIVAHKEAIKTIKHLKEAHDKNNSFPNLLLFGPPGTGKTTTILALAHELYPNNFHAMVLELNASDERGIDVVRNIIQQFCESRALFSEKNKFKMVILDECDNMTTAAQMALRRMMELYAKNARFSLICNHVNRVKPAIKSRCKQFRFPPLRDDFIKERLKHIIKSENVNILKEGIDSIISVSMGDLRSAINILEALSKSKIEITSEAVYRCTGTPTPEHCLEIMNIALNETVSNAFYKIKEIKVNNGYALMDIIRSLKSLITNKMRLPQEAVIPLIIELHKLDVQLGSGGNELIKLGQFIAIFFDVRDLMHNKISNM